MASKLKAVRVLTLLTLFGVIYEANRVLNLEQDLIKSLKESGQVDDTPAAVKYCTEELGVLPVTPKKPDAEKAAELEKLDLEIKALEAELLAAAEEDKPAIQAKLDAENLALKALTE